MRATISLTLRYYGYRRHIERAEDEARRYDVKIRAARQMMLLRSALSVIYAPPPEQPNVITGQRRRRFILILHMPLSRRFTLIQPPRVHRYITERRERERC